MTEEKTESQKVFSRMLIGGATGFVLGILIGILTNSPFAGITETSSDVQGLIYFRWLGLGVMGGVIGTLAGLIDFRKLRREKHKVGTNNKP